MTKDVLPNYKEYQFARERASEATVEKAEGDFLDGFIEYMFEDEGYTKTSFKIGKYYGRNVKTENLIPEINEFAKRTIKIILVNNTLILMDGGYLYELESTNQIIDEFMNSLRIE